MTAKFDSDPEAVAWAREKVSRTRDRFRSFQSQEEAKLMNARLRAHRNIEDEREIQRRLKLWRQISNIIEREFIGGEGCTIAAFDERLPDLVARLEEMDSLG